MGEWRAGKRHGTGDHFYKKGEIYQGEWREDCRHGKGTLNLQHGMKFEGAFYADKKHGRGRLYIPRNRGEYDFQVFAEEWEHGIMKSHRE